MRVLAVALAGSAILIWVAALLLVTTDAEPLTGVILGGIAGLALVSAGLAYAGGQR